MDWNQSRVGYYLDFALVPVLVFAAIIFSEFYQGGNLLGMAAAACGGFVLWTFLEYWIHRSLFHRVFKRGHDLHHVRPAGYIAAPPWSTTLVHVALLTSALLLGTIAVGVAIGLEAGYFAYIVLHDKMHHARTRPDGWFRNRWRLHMMHHSGLEKNFGVITSAWDRVFGTHWGPEWHARRAANKAPNHRTS